MSPQLQHLTSQFNTILNEYQETSKKYTELVNKKDAILTQIPNYSFLGETNLNVLGNSNVSGCQSACSKNTSCSGATFNTISNNCTLSGGKGNIVHNAKSIAIVEQAIYYSNRLKELNNQLSSLNEQIIVISNKNYNAYSQNKTLTKQQEVIMVNNHNVLIHERKVLKHIMNQFQTLNTAYEDGNMIVNANYMNYVVLLFVVIFLALLFLRTAISSPQYGGGLHKSAGKVLNFL